MIDPLSSLAASSGGSSIDKLVSMYMALERRPVDALKATRNTLDIRSAVFTDLKAKIKELKDLAESLSSTTDSVFSAHTVTSSDSTKATATASSSAATGTYLLENLVLAQAHRMSSPSKASGWTANASGSFTVNGVSISVTSGVTTLADIRDAINAATYETGRGVAASVINDTTSTSVLVLEAKQTGLAGAITVDDPAALLTTLGLTVSTTQSARDATFTINGVDVTRSSNSGLSDVISGLTLDLKGEMAAGSSVTLTVAGNTTAMRSKIDSFLEKLNALFDYLKDKSAVTKGSGGNYTRGSLYGYTVYTDLRSTLASDLTAQVADVPAGAPSWIYQLGIEMDDSMHFVVKDSEKLEDWLGSDPSGVAAFFGGTSGAATRVFDRLEPYVVDPLGDAKAYLDREQDTITSQQGEIDDRIDALEERLAMREQQLRQQFTRLQSLMVEAMQQQQRLQSVFSSGWGF